MKPIFITLATSTVLVVGAITLTPERTKPVIITPPEKPIKVALPPQAVQGWMNSQGVNHGNAPHVYQMLVDEEPPIVDISQVSIRDVADEYRALLDEDDVDTALNGKSANAIILEKAQSGLAKNKKDTYLTND